MRALTYYSHYYASTLAVPANNGTRCRVVSIVLYIISIYGGGGAHSIEHTRDSDSN